MPRTHGSWDRRRGGPWGAPWWGEQGPRQPPGPVLSIVVAAIQVVGAGIAANNGSGSRSLDALAYVLLLCGPAALLLRRKWPLPVLAACLAATAIYFALDYPRGPFFLAAVFALFSAARRSPRIAVWTVTASAYAGLVGMSLLLPGQRPDLTSYVALGAWTAVAVALAEAVRSRAEHLGQLRRAMAAAERARAETERAEEEQARRQAADERLRIARELHDVLGHHLSLINVRAGVGLHLLDSRPEEARLALDAIKQASAEALREVRGVLATLRPTGETAPLAPTPGLDEVEELATDLPASVQREGEVVPLPAEVDRAAYRIVQEALTNVRRHAGAGARVEVMLRYGPDHLTVRVTDDGAGPSVSTSNGSGIPGMRERAMALGGTLKAGAGQSGGFEVEAVLPLVAS